ncbi:MAG: TIGR04255 family protein [Bdellovibrionales bacterium]|nr:TIGR04255 family protein [Bdellovibrionales bacterium]
MEESLSDDSGIYPNSPLVKVVAELCFSHNFDIFANYQRYYEGCKHYFDRLDLPLPNQSSSPYQQPVIFVNKNTGQAISLAADKFSYAEQHYQNHESFFEQFLKHEDLLTKCYKEQEFFRFGFRYINFIPFSRVGNCIPLKDFFNLSVSFGQQLDEDIVDINSALIKDFGDSRLRIQFASGKDAQGREGLTLDLDYFVVNKFQREHIRVMLKNGNERIKDFFERSITEGYRNYLRGNSL